MKSPVHPDIDMKQFTKFGITIDYCPKSGGVWLDKGELEKILERSKQENQTHDPSNVPFSQEKSKEYKLKDKHHYKKKKKKSFMDDLFDFDIFD